MSAPNQVRRVLRWSVGGLGLAAAAYSGTVAAAWYRYGHPAPPTADEVDPLLDQFMPEYEIAERHSVRVEAPPDVTLAAAADADLQRSAIVRGIFTARQLFLRAKPDETARPKGLLAEMQSLGWRVLAGQPGREIVVGAVTQPWLGDVVFRGMAPHEFQKFREPDYVRIAWTLRADSAGSGASIFRTETRVATTDAAARAKFRWYWARFSPGIVLIRRVLLVELKADAERRARTAAVRPAV